MSVLIQLMYVWYSPTAGPAWKDRLFGGRLPLRNHHVFTCCCQSQKTCKCFPTMKQYLMVCFDWVWQDMGYTPDFVQSVVPLLQHIKDAGIKVVSNAGGINPSACAQALQAAAQQSGLKLSIAMVTGDDLLGKVGLIIAACRPNHYNRINQL